MIAFVADENLKRKYIASLRRLNPGIDVVRAQDVGLTGLDDCLLLEWAAEHQRVILTHDVQTLVGFAWDLVRTKSPMAGVIVIGENLSVPSVVGDLLLIAECTLPQELRDTVKFLPL